MSNVNSSNQLVSQSPNESKYKEIFNKKRLSPGTSLAKLCSEHGTSYQSYNNWLKKQRSVAEEIGHKLRVTVHISLRDLVNLIGQGIGEVPVSVDGLIRGLSPDERKTLAQALGMLKLEGLVKGQEGNA